MKANAVVMALCAWYLVAARASPSSSRLPYSGPLGLRWGQSPADVRSILANKLEFVSETPGEQNSYHTIDLRYRGVFAELPIAEALLKFHRGEFFYLSVVLQTATAGTASKVFFDALSRMKKAYGPPLKESKPPELASRRSISDHIPLADKRPWVLPLMWNERTRADHDQLHQLYDLHIRTGLWEPFAGWRFPNDVSIQVFIVSESRGGERPAVLKPVWIFAKDDKVKRWRQDVHIQIWIPPRDF